MCTNTEDFERVRNISFDKNAKLSKRHERLVQQAAQLDEFPALMVAVENSQIAEKIGDGHHELLSLCQNGRTLGCSSSLISGEQT